MHDCIHVMCVQYFIHALTFVEVNTYISSYIPQNTMSCYYLSMPDFQINLDDKRGPRGHRKHID